jgi:sialic acid synthase SpsE
LIYNNNWKVCAEIGLNHLGNYTDLKRIFETSNIANLKCAVSLQVREPEFYGKNPALELELSAYKQFRLLCLEKDIPFGLALGPVDSVDWIFEHNIQPDFIKVLSMAAEHTDFIRDLRERFECPIFISTGLSSLSTIKEVILPLINNGDYLIHTSISHMSKEQNIGFIGDMSSLGCQVCFGQHAIEPAICFASIGAGAKKIFVYIGDKSQELPDHEHAIDVHEYESFYREAMQCFEACGSIDSDKRPLNIEFIG